MNQPKRYKFNSVLLNGEAVLCMMETDGKNSYVCYSDYATVVAENERLKALVEENLNLSKRNLGKTDALRIERDTLAAENERLKESEAAAVRMIKRRDEAVARMHSKIEQLTKAGDTMADILEYKPNQVVWHQENDVAVRDWDNAKKSVDKPNA